MKSFVRVSLIMAAGIFLSISNIYSAGEKANYAPMNTYSNIDIPDGEFLHYGSYNGGMKIADLYFVTRKVFNKKGGFLYRTYFEIKSSSNPDRKIDDYTNWSSYTDFSPETGSELESVGNVRKSDMEAWAKYGMAGIVRWEYRINPNERFVEYKVRKAVEAKTNDIKYVIKFDVNFPSGDMRSGYFLPRFLNPESGGIVYTLAPEFMNLPFCVTWKINPKETVQTKIGNFSARKIEVVPADPFLKVLLEPPMKKAGYWIESSGRRIVVKLTTAMDDLNVIEEISNVLHK